MADPSLAVLIAELERIQKVAYDLAIYAFTKHGHDAALYNTAKDVADRLTAALAGRPSLEQGQEHEEDTRVDRQPESERRPTAASNEATRCPFCHDDGYDKIGLWIHISNGWCDDYPPAGA